MAHRGMLRVVLAFAALLASLSMVVWRQSQALDVLGEVEALRRARAMAESEKSLLGARIQHLESRARIMEVAGSRWGMRVPASGEVFVLRVRPDVRAPRLMEALRVATAGAMEREGSD